MTVAAYFTASTSFIALSTLIWNIWRARDEHERQARAQLFDDQIGKTISRRLGTLRDLHEQIVSIALPLGPGRPGAQQQKAQIRQLMDGPVDLCVRSLTSTLQVLERNHAAYFPSSDHRIVSQVVERQDLERMRDTFEVAAGALWLALDELCNSNGKLTAGSLHMVHFCFFDLDEQVRVKTGAMRQKVLLYRPRRRSWFRR